MSRQITFYCNKRTRGRAGYHEGRREMKETEVNVKVTENGRMKMLSVQAQDDLKITEPVVTVVFKNHAV
jgi:hypothetical protein